MKWQTEVMYRRFQAGRGADEIFPVAETFHDWGLYSQVLWGFAKAGWQAFAATICTCRIRDLPMIQTGNRAGGSARI